MKSILWLISASVLILAAFSRGFEKYSNSLRSKPFLFLNFGQFWSAFTKAKVVKNVSDK